MDIASEYIKVIAETVGDDCRIKKIKKSPAIKKI